MCTTGCGPHACPSVGDNIQGAWKRIRPYPCVRRGIRRRCCFPMCARRGPPASALRLARMVPPCALFERAFTAATVGPDLAGGASSLAEAWALGQGASEAHPPPTQTEYPRRLPCTGTRIRIHVAAAGRHGGRTVFRLPSTKAQASFLPPQVVWVDVPGKLSIAWVTRPDGHRGLLTGDGLVASAALDHGRDLLDDAADVVRVSVKNILRLELENYVAVSQAAADCAGLGVDLQNPVTVRKDTERRMSELDGV